MIFGEGILPGYPFWLEPTGGATFNDDLQKEIYSIYLDQSVSIANGDLDDICAAAKKYKMAIYLGCIERADDRGGHSVFCTLVYINNKGKIKSSHRKVMPTYEERLVWATGDGNGLRTHGLGAFTLGGLNCWENWLPLLRTALYGQGEDLHVAVWPGNVRNTIDLNRFIAQESRSYVASVCGLFSKKDIPKKNPLFKAMFDHPAKYYANGGSCLTAPDGSWVIKPVAKKEIILTAVIDHHQVRKERQNLDTVGHYSRPDVVSLSLNQERQNLLGIKNGK